MAKFPFSDSFLFCLIEKKNLSPNFGVIVFFFGLGRFSIYWVVGLLKSFFFDKRSLKRWAPCSLTDSQVHGLIKTGRFFEDPLVGRHVLNVGPKKGVNLSIER